MYSYCFVSAFLLNITCCWVQNCTKIPISRCEKVQNIYTQCLPFEVESSDSEFQRISYILQPLSSVFVLLIETEHEVMLRILLELKQKNLITKSVLIMFFKCYSENAPVNYSFGSQDFSLKFSSVWKWQLFLRISAKQTAIKNWFANR